MAVCADKISFQGQFVPVAAQGGDRLAVQIEADEPPTTLSAGVFESASGPAVQRLDRESGREAQFTVDLPGGEYYVRITGVWPAGDVGYEFMLDVEPAAGPAAFDSSFEKLRTLLVSVPVRKASRASCSASLNLKSARNRSRSVASRA